MNEHASRSQRAYRRRLFVFLGVASFFEGYDSIALSQILPALQRSLRFDDTAAGLVVGLIGMGAVFAFAVVRRADRVGRKPMLTLTIAGYTLFSFLSGLSPNVFVFVGFQFVARIFLIGEWAISMIYAAEEFPAARRGLMLGLINAFTVLGSVVCAGVVPLLLETPLGWRTVYFVGTLPLLLLAFARRSLRETERFLALSPEQRRPRDLFQVLRSPYRYRVLRLAAIWALTYSGANTAVVFFKTYAVDPRGPLGLSEAAAAQIIVLAALGSMLPVFLVGALLDRLGRRWGAVLIFGVTSVSMILSFQLTEPMGLTLAVTGAIFGSAAVLPVLNAYTTELFPTDLRSNAFAWANNILGRTGFVFTPMLVGWAATSVGWGPAVSATVVGPLLALILVLATLPETKGRELENTARLGANPGSGS